MANMCWNQVLVYSNDRKKLEEFAVEYFQSNKFLCFLIDDELIDEIEEEDSERFLLRFEFKTKSYPANDIFDDLLNRYFGLEFDFQYCEPGYDFCGGYSRAANSSEVHIKKTPCPCNEEN